MADDMRVVCGTGRSAAALCSSMEAAISSDTVPSFAGPPAVCPVDPVGAVTGYAAFIHFLRVKFQSNISGRQHPGNGQMKQSPLFNIQLVRHGRALWITKYRESTSLIRN